MRAGARDGQRTVAIRSGSRQRDARATKTEIRPIDVGVIEEPMKIEIFGSATLSARNIRQGYGGPAGWQMVEAQFHRRRPSAVGRDRSLAIRSRIKRATVLGVARTRARVPSYLTQRTEAQHAGLPSSGWLESTSVSFALRR